MFYLFFLYLYSLVGFIDRSFCYYKTAFLKISKKNLLNISDELDE